MPRDPRCCARGCKAEAVHPLLRFCAMHLLSQGFLGGAGMGPVIEAALGAQGGGHAEAPRGPSRRRSAGPTPFVQWPEPPPGWMPPFTAPSAPPPAVPSVDYYRVLRVASEATSAEVKEAYRKRAREVHPDCGGSEEAMQQVNEAWAVLGDPVQRERYDVWGAA